MTDVCASNYLISYMIYRSVYVAIVYAYTYIIYIYVFIYIYLYTYITTFWSLLFKLGIQKKNTAKFWRSWSFEENWQSDSERFLAAVDGSSKSGEKTVDMKKIPHFSDGLYREQVAKLDYTTWKVDGATPMYGFIMAPY